MPSCAVRWLWCVAGAVTSYGPRLGTLLRGVATPAPLLDSRCGQVAWLTPGRDPPPPSPPSCSLVCASIGLHPVRVWCVNTVSLHPQLWPGTCPPPLLPCATATCACPLPSPHHRIRDGMPYGSRACPRRMTQAASVSKLSTSLQAYLNVDRPVVLTQRVPELSPAGLTSDKGHAFETPAGRRVTAPRDYASACSALQPSVATALADEVSPPPIVRSSKRRLQSECCGAAAAVCGSPE